ncbi:hypothetical protein [Methylotuvimicrobium buryatense]|uniref:hypothetical protein n=1 Tax=Methylotuvimicrobium buryatense TaxID=95641 RepID=UPI001FCB3969|nr:hypothetical protein [Methylotuvimicrobium buryatense]
MDDTPKVVALTPLYAHGDTEDRPKPVPNIKRINARAAAAVAPAKIALHDTALAEVCKDKAYSSAVELLGRGIMSLH